MPRKRGMMGPGSKAMGGMGRKPPMAATPFSAGGPGGGPMGPPPSGGPRAMPGGMAGGGGMGGMMKKGGHVKKEEHKKHAHGGEVERLGKRERMEEKEEHKKYARGGAVIAGHTTHGMPGKEHPVNEGISRGSDPKRSAGPRGSDSRVHKPHSGKAS